MFPLRKFHAVNSVFLSVLLSGSAAFGQGTSGDRHRGADIPAVLIRQNHLESIYRGILERHWVPQTGLFLSYPDSADAKLSQQAATYEQAATGLLALRLGDVPRARGVYQFLRKAWMEAPIKSGREGRHGLSNFYNAYFGTDGIEKTVHTGPNAWAGLLAARLGNQVHDEEATQWALDIAYWLTNSVPHQDGAVAMAVQDAPGGAPWAHVYSTENNLSYFAFLTELLRCPRLEKSQRAAITEERDRVENWLLNTAFDRQTYRVARGVSPRGLDPIQALDTTTWFVSALGPQRLRDHDIDPVRLMKAAESAFEVRVANHIGVDSTDQAEADYIYLHENRPEEGASRPAADHHRIVWFEGLGQYILAWSEVAEDLRRQGRSAQATEFLAKARRLSDAYDHSALVDPADRTAFPYATPGRFFRDGWHAPAGTGSGAAPSLISAAWRCFAGLGVDPVSGLDVSSVQQVSIQIPAVEPLALKALPVLYGTSEEMITRAWQAVGDNRWKGAIAQANATIHEWEKWAGPLQARKMAEVGHLVEYSGDPEEKKTVFKYWALNDVAAAYFILGKALDHEGDYAGASQAFQQIANHYSLGQVWDPQGWFWAPMDAVTNEYVLRDPDHYGNVVPKLLAEGSREGKQPF